MFASVGRRTADPGSAALFRPHEGRSGRSHLPAGSARSCRNGAIGSGRPNGRCECAGVGWPTGPGLACGRAQHSVRLHGRMPGRLCASVFHRLHGPRQVRDPLLLPDADFYRRLYRAGVQRQSVFLLPVLGTGGTLLVQLGGILVHQPRSRAGRAQSFADDAHCRLRPAGRHPGDLFPHGQRAVDQPGCGAQLYDRRFSADACRPGGQVRAGSSAHMDSQKRWPRRPR